jgi:hypothetical protein
MKRKTYDMKMSRRELLKQAGFLLGAAAAGALFPSTACAPSAETDVVTLTETVTATASATANPAKTTKKPKTTTTTTTEPGLFTPPAAGYGSGVILGRPETDSITLNVMLSQNSELYVEYGLAPGTYSLRTDAYSLKTARPQEINFSSLKQNTGYYYRLRYKPEGGTAFETGQAGAFHTRRPAGESFVFTIDADPHFDKNSDPEEIKAAFLNIMSENPDFNIDLGDTFMTEKLTTPTSQQVADVYLDRRGYFALFGHSVPLFLVLGNHDGETGWLRDGTENNVAVWASNARKMYFPNPFPDTFYSGNTQEEKFIGITQNYYAWQWGDALFLALDPYWNTPVGGENGDFWDRTIGTSQYLWLKNVLEKSTARFKFIFTHHVLGNCRGGSEWCDYYEMGGRNKSGVWEFDKMRPGWELPLHQLFVKHAVTAVFQGHDHLYVRQERDGVIYQEVPQPSMALGMSGAANDGNYTSGVVFPSPGHLKVTVAPSQVTIDYIHAALSGDSDKIKNGEVVYSYSV